MAPKFDNQRPGYPICPPAVARHLVFRVLKEENPRWTTEAGNWVDSWKGLCDRLTKHACDVREAYGNSEVKIGRPGKPSDPEGGLFSTGASCLIPINPEPEKDGYRLRLRIDVHTELLSLTYIFDQIGKASELGKQLAGLSGDIPGDSPASKWLFDDMWEPDAKGQAPVKAATALARWLKRSSPSGATKLGPFITDFRGIIIGPRGGWMMDGPRLKKADTRKVREKRLNPVLADFAEKNAQLIRAIADPNSLDRTAKEASRASEHACAAGGEPVVCGMLDGEALYAASLGEWGPKVISPQPIRHLLVYAGRSYSQLGRLVRRMQVLGELRHAAIMDFEPDSPGGKQGLREASRAIRVLGGEVTDATESITASNGETSGDPTQSGIPALSAAKPPEASMEKLEYFVNELARISRMADGGLTHRIEQSRYYAQEFQASIQHLRLVRVGDWQPYDDFVQRYILHLFARIDRIGNRHEALGRRVDRLLFFQQAKLLDSYTRSVNSTVAAISNSTDALNRSAAAHTGLLEMAERFATVFLVYYAGSVFHYWFYEGRALWVVDRDWIIDKDLFVTVWASVMLGLGVWLSYHLGVIFLHKLKAKWLHFIDWVRPKARHEPVPMTDISARQRATDAR